MKRYLVLFLLCALLFASCKTEPLTLLIGTYTAEGSEGIYRCQFNPVTGEATLPEAIIKADNPSYLALSEDNTLLYAVSEGRQSALNAYRYDAATDSFSLLSSKPTLSPGPCYVALFGGYAYTANYTGGSLTAFPVAEDGSLGEPLLAEYSDEQHRSHVHGVFPAPDGQSIYVTDLGRSEIFQIEPPLKELSRVSLAEGSGPRHMAFAKSGKQAYALNELSGTVVAFDIENDGLHLKQEIASDSVGGGGSADIHLSPDGRFLYSSNRLKADGISVFRVDEADGTLEKVAYTNTGIHPRNFVLSPDGEFLLCAERDSDCIEIFRRNRLTGELTPTEHSIKVSMPVCLKWMKK